MAGSGDSDNHARGILSRQANRMVTAAYEVAQGAILEVDGRVIDKARELGLSEDAVIALSDTIRDYHRELGNNERAATLCWQGQAQ